MTTAERLDRFMARANAAYYAAKDPFSDFTTAPEISQVFGELLGAWAAVQWDALGRPDPVLLVELGPGRGTLMADALRLVRATAPGFAAALRLHFVETSPRLRTLLAARFPDATFHDGLVTLPAGPAIVLGNEFLDALPIRQWVRRGDVLREFAVVDGQRQEEASDLAPPRDMLDGDILERSDPSIAVVAALATRPATIALLVDYGGEAPFGDTLQALRGGRPADPFAALGAADLTAHVDFAGLREAAEAAGAAVHGPLAQGVFLGRLGLAQRVRRLAAGDPGAIEAANRLAQPDRMGLLFKAMAITPPGLPVPPGFEVFP